LRGEAREPPRLAPQDFAGLGLIYRLPGRQTHFSV